MKKALILVPISKITAAKMKLFQSPKMINCFSPAADFVFSDADFLKGGPMNCF